MGVKIASFPANEYCQLHEVRVAADHRSSYRLLRLNKTGVQLPAGINPASNFALLFYNKHKATRISHTVRPFVVANSFVCRSSNSHRKIDMTLSSVHNPSGY